MSHGKVWVTSHATRWLQCTCNNDESNELTSKGIHWQNSNGIPRWYPNWKQYIEEHVQTVRAVLKRLEKAKIWFNKDKCQIIPQRVELLGHVLHNNRLEADPEKIKKVVDFKTWTNRREIQRFMVVVNYLTRFCKALATKGRCLYEL